MSQNNHSKCNSPVSTKSKLRADSPAFQPRSVNLDHGSSVSQSHFPSAHAPFNPYTPQPQFMNNQTQFFPLQHQQQAYAMNSGPQYPNHQQQLYPQQLNPFFYRQQQFTPQQPLLYHLYTTPVPVVINGNKKSIHDFFIPDTLREDLQRKSEVIHTNLDITSSEYQSMPNELHGYHSLHTIQGHSEVASKSLGYPNWLYKAMNSLDGRVYMLRRLIGYKLTSQAAITALDSWVKLDHANVVQVKEAFTTRAFGDHSLVVVYAFHPLSKTLFEKHFAHVRSSTPINALKISEDILWSYFLQLLSAIHAMHQAGLSARLLDLSKVIYTSKNRVRISSAGIMDIVEYESGKSLSHSQQEDLVKLGQLMLILGSCNINATESISKSLDQIGKWYSLELKNSISLLLNSSGLHARENGISATKQSVIELIFAQAGPKLMMNLDSCYRYNDFLENELSRELENGRIVRLLCKLGFINERPEYNQNTKWSETGERYFLQLFRDYVFHQVDENGSPVVDFAHVITCLNKLDAGSPEKLMLMSRDELSSFIVSYAQIKSAIQEAFNELIRPGK